MIWRVPGPRIPLRKGRSLLKTMHTHRDTHSNIHIHTKRARTHKHTQTRTLKTTTTTTRTTTTAAAEAAATTTKTTTTTTYREKNEFFFSVLFGVGRKKAFDVFTQPSHEFAEQNLPRCSSNVQIRTIRPQCLPHPRRIEGEMM